jgi:hypothetical protein
MATQFPSLGLGAQFSLYLCRKCRVVKLKGASKSGVTIVGRKAGYVNKCRLLSKVLFFVTRKSLGCAFFMQFHPFNPQCRLAWGLISK